MTLPYEGAGVPELFVGAHQPRWLWTALLLMLSHQCLARLLHIGTGGICRQATAETAVLATSLAHLDLAVHTFGAKTLGLLWHGQRILSSDSTSWSYAGRYQPALPGCSPTYCGKCLAWATRWGSRPLSRW